MNEDISFGELVKERRNILGLTQTELAQRVGCAAITIRKIEANDLRPSVQMAKLIAVALNVPDDEQLAFVRLARSVSPPSPIPTPSPAPSEIGLTDLSGRAVKGFQLGEQIGSGGFGVVYKAVQPSIERDVAVKIILPKYANHPNFIRRFEAEAQLIARLEHPHIVPLYDYWREPDAAYLIMRLLRGGSLEDQLQAGPIPIEFVGQYIRQIGLALDLAHRYGIVHRDIKPANVLLDEEMNAYLADFGIAKYSEGTDRQASTDGSAIIGSLAYVSPEQIMAEPVRRPSDIYCLGILLYEMLTGKKPFSGPTPAAFIQQHLNELLPSIREHNPDLPPELDAVIHKATAKDPADRYQDAPALLAALEYGLSPNPRTVSPIRPKSPVVELSAQELADVENPYMGLRAFGEADADHFYGRATLIQELFAKLSDQTDLARFLAIVGPSGSGKSSVAKAGLIPALRRGGLPGSENWFILDLAPGAHPWEEVEAALLRIAVNPPESLLGQLQAGDRGLLRAIQRVLPDDGETELVLIIDQFEEIFTLVEDEALREQFLNSLVTAVLDERSRLHVIATLRADFYDRPLQYVDFGDLLRQRTVSVLPMTPDELEQAIVNPAAQLGVRLEPGLAATIIGDVGDQPGTLPLLQYVLTEMFDGRNKNIMTWASYEAIGGLSGALAQRADEIYAGLDDDGRAVTRELFLRLTTLGEGGEDTRRRVHVSELGALLPTVGAADALNLHAESMNMVINEYGRYRLLTFDRDPITRESTVEVAHEAIMREWNRLRQWLHEARDDIRQERALARAAEEWKQHGEDASFLLRGVRLEQIENWLETTTLLQTPLQQTFTARSLEQREWERQAELARQEHEARLERRSRNFLRGLVAVFALAAIISAGLGLFALQQRQAALGNAAAAQNIALVAGSQTALANNDTDAALALAWQAVNLNPDSAIAQAQLSEVAYTPGTVRRFAGHTDLVGNVVVSPDGQTMLSASEDNTMLFWDLKTGQILKKFEGHTSAVNDVAFSPDGQTAASISNEMGVIWDVQTGRVIGQFADQNFSRIAFHPDGRSMVTSSWDDRASFIQWDVHSGEVMQRFKVDTRVEEIAFTPDGSAILYGSIDDGALRLMDIHSGRIIHEMRANVGTGSGALQDIAISADGLRAISGFENSDMFLWNLEDGSLIRHYPIEGGATAVAFHPLKDTALVGGITGILRALDLETGEILQTFTGHNEIIPDLAFTPDGRYAVTASRDKTLRLWELERGHTIRQFVPPGELAFEVDLSPDGQTALSGSTDGTVTMWNVETGEVIRQHTDDQPVMAVTYSPDGKTALIGTGYRFAQKIEPGRVILWDTETGEVLRQFDGHPYAVFDVEFSPDGKQAISSGNGAMAILWDVGSGQEIHRFDDYFEDSPYPGKSFWDVEFSPDGDTILASYGFGPIVIWDAETGEEIGLRRLEARPVATLCVEAQERRELAEKQFRDREDYYR